MEAAYISILFLWRILVFYAALSHPFSRQCCLTEGIVMGADLIASEGVFAPLGLAPGVDWGENFLEAALAPSNQIQQVKFA